MIDIQPVLPSLRIIQPKKINRDDQPPQRQQRQDQEPAREQHEQDPVQHIDEIV